MPLVGPQVMGVRLTVALPLILAVDQLFPDFEVKTSVTLVPVTEASRVERLLADTRVHEVPAPSGFGPTLVEALPRMRERVEAIPRELEAIRAARADLLSRHAPELCRAALSVRDRLAQILKKERGDVVLSRI